MRLERVVFALNGRRYAVAAGDVHPGTTLLEFIRTRTPFTGTKLGCGEGQHARSLLKLLGPTCDSANCTP